MKRTALEAAKALFLKAEHDLQAVELLMAEGSTDVICFHLHQTVEKYLKAFLQAGDVEYPRTHDLDALLDLCAGITDVFECHRDHLETFIPYAVMLRYDLDYDPSRNEAREGLALVIRIRDALLALMPELTSSSNPVNGGLKCRS